MKKIAKFLGFLGFFATLATGMAYADGPYCSMNGYYGVGLRPEDTCAKCEEDFANYPNSIGDYSFNRNMCYNTCSSSCSSIVSYYQQNGLYGMPSSINGVTPYVESFGSTQYKTLLNIEDLNCNNLGNYCALVLNVPKASSVTQVNWKTVNFVNWDNSPLGTLYIAFGTVWSTQKTSACEDCAWSEQDNFHRSYAVFYPVLETPTATRPNHTFIGYSAETSGDNIIISPDHDHNYGRLGYANARDVSGLSGNVITLYARYQHDGCADNYWYTGTDCEPCAEGFSGGGGYNGQDSCIKDCEVDCREAGMDCPEGQTGYYSHVTTHGIIRETDTDGLCRNPQTLLPIEAQNCPWACDTCVGCYDLIDGECVPKKFKATYECNGQTILIDSAEATRPRHGLLYTVANVSCDAPNGQEFEGWVLDLDTNQTPYNNPDTIEWKWCQDGAFRNEWTDKTLYIYYELYGGNFVSGAAPESNPQPFTVSDLQPNGMEIEWLVERSDSHSTFKGWCDANYYDHLGDESWMTSHCVETIPNTSYWTIPSTNTSDVNLYAWWNCTTGYALDSNYQCVGNTIDVTYKCLSPDTNQSAFQQTFNNDATVGVNYSVKEVGQNDGQVDCSFTGYSFDSSSSYVWKLVGTENVYSPGYGTDGDGITPWIYTTAQTFELDSSYWTPEKYDVKYYCGTISGHTFADPAYVIDSEATYNSAYTVARTSLYDEFMGRCTPPDGYDVVYWTFDTDNPNATPRYETGSSFGDWTYTSSDHYFIAHWQQSGYQITLDPNLNDESGSASEPSTLYTKQGVGVYLNANRTPGEEMTTNSRPLTTAPTKSINVQLLGGGDENAPIMLNGAAFTDTDDNYDLEFSGFYETTSSDTPYISANLHITEDGDTQGKGYQQSKTWYAQWGTKTITLPTLTWEGHDFNGWVCNDVPVGEASIEISASTVCTAQWSVACRQVSFNDENGDVAPVNTPLYKVVGTTLWYSESTCAAGTLVSNPTVNTPTKENATFVGYDDIVPNPDERIFDGSGELTNNGSVWTISQNTELHAKYECDAPYHLDTDPESETFGQCVACGSGYFWSDTSNSCENCDTYIHNTLGVQDGYTWTSKTPYTWSIKQCYRNCDINNASDDFDTCDTVTTPSGHGFEQFAGNGRQVSFYGNEQNGIYACKQSAGIKYCPLGLMSDENHGSGPQSGPHKPMAAPVKFHNVEGGDVDRYIIGNRADGNAISLGNGYAWSHVVGDGQKTLPITNNVGTYQYTFIIYPTVDIPTAAQVLHQTFAWYGYPENDPTSLVSETLNATNANAVIQYAIEHTGDNNMSPVVDSTHSRNLYPKYTADPSYTLTYSCGDGGGTPPNSETVYAGDTVTPPYPEGCNNYGSVQFNGWSVSPAGGTRPAAQEFTWEYPVSQTFTAIWGNVNQQTIEYHKIPDAAQLASSGNTLEMPDSNSMPTQFYCDNGNSSIFGEPKLKNANNELVGVVTKWCTDSDLNTCNMPLTVSHDPCADKHVYAYWECTHPGYHLNAAQNDCVPCPDNTIWYNGNCVPATTACPPEYPNAHSPYNWSINQCYKLCDDKTCEYDVTGLNFGYTTAEFLPITQNQDKQQIAFYGNRNTYDVCAAASDVAYCPRVLIGGDSALKPRSSLVTFRKADMSGTAGIRYIIGNRDPGHDDMYMSTGSKTWSHIVGLGQQSAAPNESDTNYTLIIYPTDAAPNPGEGNGVFKGYYDAVSGGTRYVESLLGLNATNAASIISGMSPYQITNRTLYPQYCPSGQYWNPENDECVECNDGYQPNANGTDCEAIKYDVRYVCNDAGNPYIQEHGATYGEDYTVLSRSDLSIDCTAPAGKRFNGWNLNTPGSATPFAEGDQIDNWPYTMSEPTFTADWQDIGTVCNAPLPSNSNAEIINRAIDNGVCVYTIQCNKCIDSNPANYTCYTHDNSANNNGQFTVTGNGNHALDNAICAAAVYQTYYRCNVGDELTVDSTGATYNESYTVRTNGTNDGDILNCVAGDGQYFAGWEFNGDDALHAGGSPINPWRYYNLDTPTFTASFSSCPDGQIWVNGACYDKCEETCTVPESSACPLDYPAIANCTNAYNVVTYDGYSDNGECKDINTGNVIEPGQCQINTTTVTCNYGYDWNANTLACQIRVDYTCGTHGVVTNPDLSMANVATYGAPYMVAWENNELIAACEGNTGYIVDTSAAWQLNDIVPYTGNSGNLINSWIYTMSNPTFTARYTCDENFTAVGDECIPNYTITYQTYGGTPDPNASDSSYPHTYNTNQLPVYVPGGITREHSQFQGWCLNENLTNCLGTMGEYWQIPAGTTDNLTLYAKWSCDTGYTLSGHYCISTSANVFYECGDACGGTHGEYATPGEQYIIKTPSEIGCTCADTHLANWQYNGTGYTPGATIPSWNNQTPFVANWKVYTVNLDKNASGATNGNVEKIYEKYSEDWYKNYSGGVLADPVDSLSGNDLPTWSGHVLNGYYDAQNDGETIGTLSGTEWTLPSATTAISDGTTWYAHWAECQCTAGTGASACDPYVANNVCGATGTCDTGYENMTVTCNNNNCVVTCSQTSYTAKYLCGDGATGTSITDTGLHYNTTYNVRGNTGMGNPGCAKSNYTFNGWFFNIDQTSYNGGDSITWPASDGTFTANWCHDCNPGTGATCVLNVSNAGVCEYTTACEPGYGSIQNPGQYNPSCSITECPIGYHVENNECVANTINITYSSGDANNVTPPTEPSSCTYGETFNLPVALTDPNGAYSFNYWGTNGTVHTQFNASAPINCTVQDLGVSANGATATVTAQWNGASDICSAQLPTNPDPHAQIVGWQLVDGVNPCVYTIQCEDCTGTSQPNLGCYAHNGVLSFTVAGGTSGTLSNATCNPAQYSVYYRCSANAALILDPTQATYGQDYTVLSNGNAGINCTSSDGEFNGWTFNGESDHVYSAGTSFNWIYYNLSPYPIFTANYGRCGSGYILVDGSCEQCVCPSANWGAGVTGCEAYVQNTTTCSANVSCGTGYGNGSVSCNGAECTPSCEPNQYEINLDKNVGDFYGIDGQTLLYTIYNSRVYRNYDRTEVMTQNQNPLENLPQKYAQVTFNHCDGTGSSPCTTPANSETRNAYFDFNGFYEYANSSTPQYISWINNGWHITQDGIDDGISYTNNEAKWYAHWAGYGTINSSNWPTNPTRSGYTFVAWKTAANCGGNVVTSSVHITDTNTEFFACWEMSTSNECKVYCDVSQSTCPYANATCMYDTTDYQLGHNNGQAGAPCLDNDGNVILPEACPIDTVSCTQSGYIWVPGDQQCEQCTCTPGTGVSSCTPGVTGNQCTATGECANGYSNFTSNCNGTNCATSCSSVGYTVTYNCGDGQGNPPVETIHPTYLSTYTVLANNSNNCYYPNHVFNGWKFNVDGGSYNGGAQLTWPASNGTFTAQWNEASDVCSAQLPSNAHATITDVAIENGQCVYTVQCDACAGTGSAVYGCYTHNSSTEFTVNGPNSGTLTGATCTANQYDIDYTNGWTGVFGASTVYCQPRGYTYGTMANITCTLAPVGQNTHAIFNGWCTNSSLTDCSNTTPNYYTIGSTDYGDKQYFANWSCESGYHVNGAQNACVPNGNLKMTYRPNGGTPNQEIEISYNFGESFSTLAGTTYSKNSEKITRWDIVSGGTNWTGGYLELSSPYTYDYNGDTVVQAHWEQCTCTKGTGVSSCTPGVTDNQCTATGECANGYSNFTSNCNGTNCATSCSADEFTVTFKCSANGGVIYNPQHVGLGGTVYVPAASLCSNTGYTFTQWKNSDNTVNISTTVSTYQWNHAFSATLTPDWVGDIFEVTLHENDGVQGSGFVSKLWERYGDGWYRTNTNGVLSNPITAFNSSQLPIRAGYTFAGYTLLPTGGAQRTIFEDNAWTLLSTTTITSNEDWYAQWSQCLAGQYYSNGSCHACEYGYTSEPGATSADECYMGCSICTEGTCPSVGQPTCTYDHEHDMNGNLIGNNGRRYHNNPSVCVPNNSPAPYCQYTVSCATGYEPSSNGHECVAKTWTVNYVCGDHGTPADGYDMYNMATYDAQYKVAHQTFTNRQVIAQCNPNTGYVLANPTWKLEGTTNYYNSGDIINPWQNTMANPRFIAQYGCDTTGFYFPLNGTCNYCGGDNQYWNYTTGICGPCPAGTHPNSTHDGCDAEGEYEITLDKNVGSLHGSDSVPSKLYTRHNTGVYRNPARTEEMTQGTYPLSVKAKKHAIVTFNYCDNDPYCINPLHSEQKEASFVFNGFYQSSDAGQQYIYASGYITPAGLEVGKSYTDNNHTWYAQWGNYGELDANDFPTPSSNDCYEFAGWWTSSIGGTQVPTNQTYIVTGDTTLYARWTRKTYTINYVMNGGKNYTGAPTYYECGVGETINGTPTRGNSSFEAWCDDAALTVNCAKVRTIGTTDTGDKTFYAKWSCDCGYSEAPDGQSCVANTITVNYQNDCGDVPSSTTCTYDGPSFTLPTEMVNPGYNFNGWSVNYQTYAPEAPIACNSATLGVCSGSVTVSAVCGNPQSYNITYHMNGGVNYSGAPTTYTHTVGATINGTPTRGIDPFMGWCDDAALTVNCNKVRTISPNATGNIDLYAKWSCDYCGSSGSASNGQSCLMNTITLNYNNGGIDGAQTPNNTTCTYGQYFQFAPAMSASCHTFNNWSVNGKTFSANQTNVLCNYDTFGICGGSVNINATWNHSPTILDWDENGGSPIANGSCNYNEQSILPSAPERAGYTFSGWELADSGQIKSAGNTFICNETYTGVACGTSTAIKAVWCRNCTQTNPEDVACQLDAQSSPGSCIYACPAGYTFENSGPTCVKKQYSITYNPNGGVGTPKTDSVSYNDTFTTRPRSTFTNAGYKLERWNTVSGGSYPIPGHTYTYKTLTDTVLEADWRLCTCTAGTGVSSCTPYSTSDSICGGKDIRCKTNERYANPSVDCGTDGGPDCVATCTQCDAGSISNGTTCDQCDAGHYQSGNDCPWCEGNTISAAGSTTCTQCPDNQVANATHTACGNCQNGYIFVDGQCEQCQCNMGTGVSSCSAQSTNDNTCTVTPICEAHHVLKTSYCTGANCYASCEQCQDGYIANPITNKCEPCPAGTYQSGDQCLTCGWNQISHAAAQSCEECTGRTVANATHTQCEECPLGSVAVNGVCTQCPAGSYQYENTCYACEGNTISAHDGATSCTECPVGQVANASHTECGLCPDGKIAVNGQCVPCQCNMGNGVVSCPVQSTNNNTCTADPVCAERYVLQNLECNGATCDASCEECAAGWISVDGECHQCTPGTYQSGNQCKPCPDGKTSYAGAKSVEECFIGSCPEGYHMEHGNCEPNEKECNAPNAATATRTWNASIGAYGECIIETCIDGYHLAANACVFDVCSVAHGHGMYDRDPKTGEWGCVITKCDPGYELNNASTACVECYNRRVNGEVAVSSYVSECEIAACMYQGQKYTLVGNECQLICENKTDETGEMVWDNNRKQCVRTCNIGYKMW